MRCGRAPWAVSTAAVWLIVTGCGGSTKGEISGTVKYDGAAVENGYITFVPVDGEGQTTGGKIRDGHYAVANVSIGKMKVVVKWTIAGEEIKREGPTGRKLKEMLPAKYSDIEQSELRYDVTAGPNQKDFDLPK
jgi:hypothetical protein